MLYRFGFIVLFISHIYKEVGEKILMLAGTVDCGTFSRPAISHDAFLAYGARML